MPLDATLPADSPAVRAALLQLRCQQGVRLPYVVLVLTILIIKLIWDYESAHVLLVWAIAVCSVLFFRSRQFNKYAERPPDPADIDRIGRDMSILSFLAGAIGGSAGWLFFPNLSLVEQALLSMIMVCWSAIAVGTTSTTPRFFLVFALPLLGPLGCSWLWSGIPQGPYVGALIFFFLGVQHLIARDNGKQLLRSIIIRQKNLNLIDELQREREEADAARETAEAASRAKSRFLAAASHDLRQPMHALSLYSAALSGTVTQPRVQKIASNIGVCVDSLDNLFEALLDISKLDASLIVPQMHEIEVQALLDRLKTEFTPQARAKGLALTVGRHTGRIRNDPVIVERILRNLLDNAVRYTPRGSITLDARDMPGGVEISVSDTGVGISPHEQERIFEEFYQVKGEAPGATERIGLGLGLATVHRMVNLLGGTIRLQSVAGRGSTFTLRLFGDPGILPHAEAAERVGAATACVDLRDRLVLVIEDDPNAREAMGTLLISWGCTCRLAATIDEALEVVRNSPKAPDIVLADYRLANGVTGIEAIQAVAKLLGVPLDRMRALIITGATDLRAISEMPGARPALLHKPLKAALLRAEIEKLFSGTETDASAAVPPPASL